MSSILDAVYHTVRQYPGGAESLAPRMNCSVNVLRNKVNPSIDTHHVRLDEAQAIMGLTGNITILHAMAAEHGYVVIPDMGLGEFSNEDLLVKFNDLYGRIGDLAANTNKFIADGVLDDAERRRLHAHVRGAVAQLHELQRLIEKLYGAAS